MEDYEEGMCGKLVKAMCGMRDAPQNWEYAHVSFAGGVGFVGKSYSLRILS